jgi:hypothetical protein
MKKKWYWIIGIVIIVLIAIFILVFLTGNITPVNPKSEFLQKMNTVVQNYNISSYKYTSRTAGSSGTNQSIFIENGRLLYYKEEFESEFSPGPTLDYCKREFKDGKWTECFCTWEKEGIIEDCRKNLGEHCHNSEEYFCNDTLGLDSERKREYLDSVEQLKEFNVQKSYTTKDRTCYFVYDNDTTKCNLGEYLYCFNKEDLLVNIIDYYGGFYIEGYPEDNETLNKIDWNLNCN